MSFFDTYVSLAKSGGLKNGVPKSPVIRNPYPQGRNLTLSAQTTGQTANSQKLNTLLPQSINSNLSDWNSLKQKVEHQKQQNQQGQLNLSDLFKGKPLSVPAPVTLNSLKQSDINARAANTEKQGTVGKVLAGIGNSVANATGASALNPNGSLGVQTAVYQKMRADNPTDNPLPYYIGNAIGYGATMLPMMVGGGGEAAAPKLFLGSEDAAAQLAGRTLPKVAGELALKEGFGHAGQAVLGGSKELVPQVAKPILGKLATNALKNQVIGSAYQLPITIAAGAKNGENLKQIAGDVAKSELQMAPFSLGMAGLGAGAEALGRIRGKTPVTEIKPIDNTLKPVETSTAVKLSPVVNDTVYYHGSPSKITEIIPGSSTGKGEAKSAIFLTTDKDVAAKYKIGRGVDTSPEMAKLIGQERKVLNEISSYENGGISVPTKLEDEYGSIIDKQNAIRNKLAEQGTINEFRVNGRVIDSTTHDGAIELINELSKIKDNSTLTPIEKRYIRNVLNNANSRLYSPEETLQSQWLDPMRFNNSDNITKLLSKQGIDGITFIHTGTPKIGASRQTAIFDANKVAPLVNDTVKVDTALTKAQTGADSVLKPVNDGIGARNLVSTPTKDLIDKYGQIDTGENPTRIMQVPNKTADNMAVSKYVRTVGESKNVTDGQAISLENKAAKGDFSHIIKTDKVAVANADKVISDEGISGSTRQWERISSGTKPATKEDMALAQQLLTEAYTRGDIAGAERLVSQITVEGTRSGQVVQSMRLLKKMTPQGKLYYLQKYVDKANSDLSLKIGDRATKIEISPELAKQLLGATTTRDIGEAEKQIIIEVAKQTPATWGDRLNAWRYMSMLANPLTHLRNVYGNTFFVPVRKFASLITAGAEKVMRVPTGERTSSVLIPFLKKDRAMVDFAKNDYKEIGDILHGGKFNENSNIINDNKPIFVSKNKVLNTLQKPLEATRKGSMWGLGHEDIFFSKPAYTDYMSQYMKSNKLTPEFLGNGTNEAEAALEKGRKYAIQQAKRATFNEANSFATWINKSEKKSLQYGTPGKVGYMAIEGLTPFKKTPFNIVKRGLEYSPLNLIKSVSTDLIKVNAGKMEATDAIRHFAEGLTGTGLMGLGMFLSAQGLITGKVDTTGKQGDYDAQNGVQQYSLNIGNHSYTINWMAPEIMPVMMGSEIYQSFVKDNPKDVMGASVATFNHLLSATSSITDPVFDLTMLQGVNNLFSQSFGNSAMQQIEKTIPSFAGQFVPTALGQVARISQPNRKDTSTSDPMNKLLGINKVVAKIPGLANSLPDKTDLWGKPISNGSLPLRLFSNLASPGYLGTKQNSPVDTEVQRLKTATNNTAALPAAAPSTITDPNTKKTIYMTAQEKALYQQIMGQTAFSALSQLINNPMYRSLPDQQNGATNDKLSFVSKVYTDARAKAVNTILSNRNIHILTASQTKIANKLTPQQKMQSRQGATLNKQIGLWTK